LNKNKFDRDKYIIATEGLLDAYSIGHQGTSYLGGYISDDFIKKLLKLTDVGVILAPDNPSIDKRGKEAISKFMKERISNDSRIKFFIYPSNSYKDINNIVAKDKIDDVYRFVAENSYSKVMYRIKTWG
jgi:hypothetical protein